MNEHLTPSAAMMAKIKDAYSMMLVPEDFLRVSGELFAQSDSAWKSAKNAALSVEQEIADFLCSGLVHVEALELCSMHREALMAMVSMLISIDMCGIDGQTLGSAYLKLHERLLEESARLCMECEGDDYAEPHAKAILIHAANLFVNMHGHECNGPKTAGLLEGSQRLLIHSDEPLNRAEIYVDIFSRLHAIGS